MNPPVDLSDLPAAGSVAPTDLMLVRKGFTDYQATVQMIQEIDFSLLNPVGSSTQANDLIMIQRGSGKMSVQFCQMGFPTGTKMWFWQATPPSPNWSLIPNTGDRLLACQDNTNKYFNNTNPGGSKGTWQQTDHILTIDQIPAHTHSIRASSDSLSGANQNYARTGKNDHDVGNITSRPTGGGNGHNHGNIWRPLANVGIMGLKNY